METYPYKIITYEIMSNQDIISDIQNYSNIHTIIKVSGVEGSYDNETSLIVCKKLTDLFEYLINNKNKVLFIIELNDPCVKSNLFSRCKNYFIRNYIYLWTYLVNIQSQFYIDHNLGKYCNTNFERYAQFQINGIQYNTRKDLVDDLINERIYKFSEIKIEHIDMTRINSGYVISQLHKKDKNIKKIEESNKTLESIVFELMSTVSRLENKINKVTEEKRFFEKSSR
jgi:hypothetical protein